MRKLVVLFLMGIAFSFSLNAQLPQYNDVEKSDITTPRYTPVVTWVTEESLFSVRLGYQ